MQLFENRKIRVGLVLALGAFLFFQVKAQMSPTQPVSDEMPEWDTGGKVPGDPSRAVQDLKDIYRSINVFRAKQGHYPESLVALMSAAMQSPVEYGFRTKEAVKGIFTNPDAKYADSEGVRQNPTKFLMYQIESTRQNGERVGSPKQANTKDVLAWTDLYVHENAKQRGEERTTNPVGFYMVLWDDGTVEKVSYDQALWVPKKDDEWKTAFPGQAGLPSGTLTYDQFYVNVMGFQKAPHGKVGAKGMTYQSK